MDTLLYYPGSWDRLTLIAMGLLIVIVGLLLLVLPYWYTPIFAINMY